MSDPANEIYSYLKKIYSFHNNELTNSYSMLVSSFNNDNSSSKKDALQLALKIADKEFTLVNKCLTLISETAEPTFSESVTSDFGVKESNAKQPLSLPLIANPASVNCQNQFPIRSLVVLPETFDKEWMLVNILSFDPITKTYLIEDVSEDEDSTGKKLKRLQYTAKPNQLLQIYPDDATALNNHIFQVNETVIGLFPNTTCLYHAIVAEVPSRKKKIFEYQLQFENDEIDGQIPWRIVPAKFVLARPSSLIKS